VPPRRCGGENLSVTADNSSDWFLSSAALRAGLQSAHTQIVRIPVRGPQPNQSGIANWDEFQEAAEDVHDLAMSRLLILRNPEDPALLADDTQVVQFITTPGVRIDRRWCRRQFDDPAPSSEPDTPEWDPVCGPQTGSQSGRWR
jgi:hypothetical protein